jgi:hypothetical protein
MMKEMTQRSDREGRGDCDTDRGRSFLARHAVPQANANEQESYPSSYPENCLQQEGMSVGDVMTQALENL